MKFILKICCVAILSVTITAVFTSCKTVASDMSSEIEIIDETIIEGNVEEPSSSDVSDNAATSAPSEAQTSTAQTTTSSNTIVASSTQATSGCTHPDYYEYKGRSKVSVWLPLWYDRKPGIENKFELFTKCEEPREVIYKCPVCLEPVLVETLDPLGHDFSGEEEIVMYPSVSKEGSWGIKCSGRAGYCGEILFTTSIPKRGGNYDSIDSCFTVKVSSSDNHESYYIDYCNISISDFRTWGNVPTIEFDTKTYTGTISYVLQDGSLYKKNIYIDKTIMTEGVHYLGKILESGEYEDRYWTLASNGTGPS